MSKVYYNENDAGAAAWLESLIKAGLIAYGDVDTRSIRDVRASDLRGYTQHHFFAGIGGWSYALRLAGWSDRRAVWTGSCPCQPYSVAGKGKGTADDRDLWPTWFNLIREFRPATVFGEQVDGAIAHGWLDRTADDLETEGYAIGAAVLPACSVGAPHRRNRLWFGAMANTACSGRGRGRGKTTSPENRTQIEVNCCGESKRALGDSDNIKRWTETTNRDFDNRTDTGRQENSSNVEASSENTSGALGNPSGARSQIGKEQSTWQECATVERTSYPEWEGNCIVCADGKKRRYAPGVPWLANGLSPFVVRGTTGFGNAIVPQVAAEFIKAFDAVTV